MGFNEIANSPLMYGMVIFGIALVAGLCIVFLKKGLTRCRELSIPGGTIKQVIRSNLIYTIVPSLSIIVGLASMATVLGVALPWWRLSVLGSLAYEMSTASMTGVAMGFESLGAMAATNDPSHFVAVFMSMSFGLVVPLILLVIFGKKMSMGMMKARASTDKKKSDWSVVLGKTFLMTVMSSLIPMMFLMGKTYGFTFLVSILLAIVFDWLIQKKGVTWLGNFSLAFCLILSMVASVFLEKLFA